MYMNVVRELAICDQRIGLKQHIPCHETSSVTFTVCCLCDGSPPDGPQSLDKCEVCMAFRLHLVDVNYLYSSSTSTTIQPEHLMGSLIRSSNPRSLNGLTLPSMHRYGAQERADCAMIVSLFSVSYLYHTVNISPADIYMPGLSDCTAQVRF